jgi:hypothetical protein
MSEESKKEIGKEPPAWFLPPYVYLFRKRQAEVDYLEKKLQSQ